MLIYINHNTNIDDKIVNNMKKPNQITEMKLIVNNFIPFNNSKLILAIAISASLMFVILLIPGLRDIFSIPVLPMGNIIEACALVLAPIVIVEIFKLLKINTTKDE